MANNREFFDKDEVAETHSKKRKRPDNPNDALERPLFVELAGDLNNLNIIDLGCGDGSFGLEALNKGAVSYEGVEPSEAMFKLARRVLAHTPAKLHHKAIGAWRDEAASADIVSARLSLNYVAALPPVFDEVYKALRPGGRFNISVDIP